MALVNCRECGARISSDAVNCPQCGVTARAVKIGHWLLAGAMLLLGVLWVAGTILG